VLTDNGLHFADPLGESWTAAEIKELIARTHAFEYTCAKAIIASPSPRECADLVRRTS
jgi:hypothetical protein